MKGSQGGILPAGPLMKEHRLIERMIALIEKSLHQTGLKKQADVYFIDNAVDFLRTYADENHHGKEEDILFAALKEKQLSAEHAEIMEGLKRDHVYGRGLVKGLALAAEKYKLADPSALKDVIERMKDLVLLYPRHIETEDKRFFLPVMEILQRLRSLSTARKKNMISLAKSYCRKK